MKQALFWDILKHFAQKQCYCFSYHEVVRAFPNRNQTYIGNVLTDMVNTGKLYKIKRGLYHIIPLESKPEIYKPDGMKVVSYLMEDHAYYIGYEHALKVHGIFLQSQYKDKMTIAINKKLKLTSRKIGPITYQFTYLDDHRFFGFSECHFNDVEKTMVSDLEKTIVDMATNPKLGGGIRQLAHVLYQAHGRVDNDKLFHYLEKNSHEAAKKRILYLTELLELGWTQQHEKMLKTVGIGTNLLDPSERKYGKTNPRFSLKINVNLEIIKQQL